MIESQNGKTIRREKKKKNRREKKRRSTSEYGKESVRASTMRRWADDLLGLDWRQVDTRDLDVWEFVRKLYRPAKPKNRLEW